MSVIVVGAGIGGLATALSLDAAGIGCRVYESVETIEPLGVGINVLPHAVRELTELGLLDALRANAVETSELVYFNKLGQEIWREPRGVAAGYRWPQFSIHRGALQRTLLDAVRTRIGASAVANGHALSKVEATESGVIATFIERRTAASHAIEGDCLVAADGIHSRVRAQLYPNEGPPKWNGAMLWRGTSGCAPFLSGRSMFMAGHQSQKFVAYPIVQAGDRVTTNWIAELKSRGVDAPRREDWNRKGKLGDFLPAFDSWRFGWLDVPALIRSATAVYEFPMVDRDPLPRWSFGAITLLGDAAHPMYPIGSNGASQAILDARVLALSLARERDPVAAFAAYEAERRPATAAIVAANRGNGPEQVMQIAEERAPNGFRNIDDVIPRAEREAIANRYKQIAGFERDALNARRSLSAIS